MISPLIELIYPRLCCACSTILQKKEKLICTRCHYHLPKTGFHLWPDNPLAKVFWGRVQLDSAFAMYYYTKGGKVQHLLHELKYHGQQEAGIYLGQIYAHDLMRDEALSSTQLIIPVPLHLKRLKTRGYNQSECFARGLSEISKIPVCTENLIRTYASSTQTRKSRYHRWENVKEIFRLERPDELEGKTLLLVDDVITTGATIEACCLVLQEASDVRIKVAAIATAV